MNTNQIAWAAGLFEGEGCIYLNDGYICLTLSTVDADIAERFHKVVGVGNLNGPYARGKNKPIYDWRCTKRADALTLLGYFAPFLGERRLKKFLHLLHESKRSKSRLNEAQREYRNYIISQDRENGMTLGEIGKRHGISRSRVCQILNGILTPL